jgi:hypothetical protein
MNVALVLVLFFSTSKFTVLFVVVLETGITVMLESLYAFLPPHVCFAFLFFVIFVGLSTFVDESYDLVHSLIFYFQTLISFEVVKIFLSTYIKQIIQNIDRLKVNGLECVLTHLTPGNLNRYWIDVLLPFVLVFFVVFIFAMIFLIKNVYLRLKELIAARRIQSISQLREFTFYSATEDESIRNTRDTYESDDLFFGAESILSDKEEVNGLIEKKESMNPDRIMFDIDRGMFSILFKIILFLFKLVIKFGNSFSLVRCCTRIRFEI